MVYLQHIPAAPLNAYIDDLYYLNGPAPQPRLKVLPMPSLHLMVNLGPAFQVHASENSGVFATCAESWWVGLWSQYHIVDWPPHTQFYGVHFKPGGAYPFLQFPLSELHNQVVALNDIWGSSAAEIREQLYAEPTVKAGFELLEQLLLARLQEISPALDMVQYAITEIERQQGRVSMRHLSDTIGVSHNYLGRLFNRIVGIPPKELARFYRFAHVLRLIDPQQVDWARVARLCGYYDQPHFNKEFLAFTGHTPTDYLRLIPTDQTRNLGQLPIG